MTPDLSRGVRCVLVLLQPILVLRSFSMRRLVIATVLGFLVLCGALLALAMRSGSTAGPPPRVSVERIGTTNVPNGGKLGWGTPEFPNVDLGALQLMPPSGSWAIELFRITNGSRMAALISLQSIEIWQGGEWVRVKSINGSGDFFAPPPVERGRFTILPIPVPQTDQPWRIRLGVQEYARGAKGVVDQFTVKHYHRILFPGRTYSIESAAQ